MIQIPDWIKNITACDLPAGRMREIADINGVLDAVALLFGVPGIRLYIPVYGLKKVEVEYARKNYNGKNKLSIISHLKITLKRFNHILKGKYQFDKKPFLSNAYIRMVADKCGEDVAIRLVRSFAGEFIYIPRISGLIQLKRQCIIREFNGRNSSDLALKYDLTERYINKVISDHHHKKHLPQSKPDAVQTDLF